MFKYLDSSLCGNGHYSLGSLLKSHPAAKAGIWMVNQASVFNTHLDSHFRGNDGTLSLKALLLGDICTIAFLESLRGMQELHRYDVPSKSILKL